MLGFVLGLREAGLDLFLYQRQVSDAAERGGAIVDALDAIGFQDADKESLRTTAESGRKDGARDDTFDGHGG